MSHAFSACQTINQQLDRYHVGDYLLMGSFDGEHSNDYYVVIVTKITKGIANPLLNKFIVTPRIDAKFIKSGHEGVLAIATWKNFGGSMYTPDYRWTLDFRGYWVESTDRMVIRKHMEREIEIERIREEEQQRYRAIAEEEQRLAREQVERNNQLISKSELDDLARQMRQ